MKKPILALLLGALLAGSVGVSIEIGVPASSGNISTRDEPEAWSKRGAGLFSARHANAPRADEVGLASARLGTGPHASEVPGNSLGSSPDIGDLARITDSNPVGDKAEATESSPAKDDPAGRPFSTVDEAPNGDLVFDPGAFLVASLGLLALGIATRRQR